MTWYFTVSMCGRKASKNSRKTQRLAPQSRCFSRWWRLPLWRWCWSTSCLLSERRSRSVPQPKSSQKLSNVKLSRKIHPCLALLQNACHGLQTTLLGHLIAITSSSIPKPEVLIELKHRPVPARIIDTFAFGNKFEVEELVLRLYEMGSEVSEFHIVEGDKDFTGASKAYEFPAILQSGKIRPMEGKDYIPQSSDPCRCQGLRFAKSLRDWPCRSEMRSATNYDPSDILLEGDLDEIVSHLVLQALKHCAPVSGVWKRTYSNGKLHTIAQAGPMVISNCQPPRLTLVRVLYKTLLEELELPLPVFLAQSIWAKPNLLSLKHGMGQSGWHFSWTLNGTQGLARKVLYPRRRLSNLGPRICRWSRLGESFWMRASMLISRSMTEEFFHQGWGRKPCHERCRNIQRNSQRFFVVSPCDAPDTGRPRASFAKWRWPWEKKQCVAG